MRGRAVGATAVMLMALVADPAAAAPTPRWRDMGVAKPLKPGSLNQVEFADTKFGWAAGYEGKNVLAVWHWNGRKWTRLRNSYDFAPAAMAVAGRKQAWILGVSFKGAHALHFNGRAWKWTRFPGPGLPVDIASGKDGAAVSIAGDLLKGRFAVHVWKGGGWTRANPPLPTGSSLTSVGAFAKNDVWLGGVTSPDGKVFESLLLHWDGAHWERITVGVQGDKPVPITKIVASSRGKIWALRGSGPTSLIRYNGRSVAEAPLPDNRGALTLTEDGAGGVWVLPFSASNATATPYLHWTKGQWLPAWGPKRRAVPGLGDIERVPGTQVIVSAGALEKDRRKTPFLEVYR